MATAIIMLLFCPAAAARRMMDNRHHQARPASDLPIAEPQYFTQRLDHFDGATGANWQQAYYVNDTFWEGADKGAPVFLCVGGEGPAFDGHVVRDSVHCNNAVEWLKENKAIMFAVQHRYYGCHSVPGEPLVDCPVKRWSHDRNADLKYLSSHQALADLANFHAFMSHKYSLSPANKWVSWGGSYPGMLAAWVRLRFPHLIHAAVSSSAPVRAKEEMTEYNDIAAAAYSVASVGGSKACTAAIAKGHELVGELMLSAPGRATLGHLFHLDNKTAAGLANRPQQRDFAGEGVAYFPSQGNDPASTEPFSNIKLICEMMTNTSAGDEVKRLAAVRYGQQSWLRATGESSAGMPDFWGYQTCTEFAFYQTCDVGSDCMYTQGLDLLSDEEAFCQSEFKIPEVLIKANVDATNAFYGSDRPAGTRVLWVNGEVDPWHGLSVLKNLSAEMPAIWVPGASHHAWTHPSADCTQDTVIQARKQIRDQVTKWLAEE